MEMKNVLQSHQSVKYCIHVIRSLIMSLAMLSVITGCASTRMRSFVDPDFKDHRYRNILVAVRYDNIDQQADAEDIFVKCFLGIDGSCKRSLDILPPTRQFEDQELLEVLAKNGIDAFMVIRQTEYWEVEQYIPQTTTSHTSGSFSSNTYYGRNRASTYGSGQQRTRTHTSGGYMVTKPRVRHKVELYDVATGKLAWTGGSLTRGNAYAGFKNLIDALGTETKKELLLHGLITMPLSNR